MSAIITIFSKNKSARLCLGSYYMSKLYHPARTHAADQENGKTPIFLGFYH
jgi:hypothetical protein